MKITFTEQGWDDYLWFQKLDQKLLNKINALIKKFSAHPLLDKVNPNPSEQIFLATGQDGLIANIS
jgi:toxin YoeB